MFLNRFRPSVYMWILLGIVIMLLSACQVEASPLGTVPGGSTIRISGTATPSDAPAPGTATALVVPTATQTAETSTVEVLPTDVQLITALVNVNIRSGPGLDYDVVSFLSAGQSRAVNGVSQDNGWWSISCPNSNSGCWIVAQPDLTQPSAEPSSATASTPAPGD